MDKVEAFLRKQHKTIKEERDRVLIELGLCEKEYYQYEGYSPDYPEYEQVNGVAVYFRYVPIEVTEEQWKAIVFSVKKVEEAKGIVAKKTRDRKTLLPMRYGSSDSVNFHWNNKLDLGESKVANIIKAISGVLGAFMIIAGIITSGETGSAIPFLIFAAAAAINLLLSCSFTSVLDYLANLTAVIRGGFKFENDD